MTKKYFGTDGIRDRVGSGLIRPDNVLKLGWATGKVLKAHGESKVLIGKDTRISGYMFESALEAGLISAGIDVFLLGPMPTPAVAYLTQTFHADAGIVISASHNPHYDNGIKFFGAQGHKISDAIEKEIEAAYDSEIETVASEQLGKAKRIADAAGRYIEFCKSTYDAPEKLEGLKVVLDCANGATYHIAPHVFEELGAEVHVIGDSPNGLNINQNCGATDLTALKQSVIQHNADMGIAFDGDGDRVMMVDRFGREVDGDLMLYILADYYAEQGSGVVGTVMSNLGLENALKGRGIEFQRAQVGDRHVMEQLVEKGWLLGAEPSGHVLCLDKHSTGDGIIAALQVIAQLKRQNRTLEHYVDEFIRYPQVLKNVPIKQRKDLEASEALQREIATVEAILGPSGRTLIRMSGTEPIIRVMVEGEDAELVEQCVQRLVDTVVTEF
ncbi:phosphoglucosamine mutase [Galenea microaerophila]